MTLSSTLLVMLGLMTFMLLGSIASNSGGDGLMDQVKDSGLRSSIRLQSVTAFNLAEAGVDLTMSYLSNQSSAPAWTTAQAPSLPGSSPVNGRSQVSLGNGTFSVVVYPDATNSGNQQKKYLIESVGVSGASRVILHAYIENSSLSKWLVLVDKWPTGNYWVSDLSFFDGPVHDNNNGGSNENIYWKKNPTKGPMWTYTGSDAYEVGSTTVNWYSSSGAGAPNGYWNNIFAGGQGTMTTGAKAVSFPTTSNTQLNAALGSSSVPSSTGVQVSADGGIYIHCKNSWTGSTAPTPNNDVQQMSLSVDASGNQVITVIQTDDNNHLLTTAVTLDVANHRTQVVTVGFTAAGLPTTSTQMVYSGTAGVTNGVVYCDGNIGMQGSGGAGASPGDPSNGSTKTGGLAGTVADNQYDSNGSLLYANKLSIVTDSTKNLNIDGDIVYKTARAKDATTGAFLPESQDANFIKKAGTLGIVSNNVLIMQKKADGTALNNLEVDGTVLAYNQYEVDQYNSRPVGNWVNMGGYLSKNMGFFGQFDNSTGNLVHGMNNDFHYDARMRDNPPPFFPTSTNGYDLISWRRVAATIP